MCGVCGIMLRFPSRLDFISPVGFTIIGSAMGLQENIAAAMRAVMERRGKSLSDFSEELGISRNALHDYLRGRCNPSIAALVLGLFELDKRESALLLLDTIQEVAELPESRRLRFAELFLEMIALWSS